MKNFMKITVVLLALVFMSYSCEKDDPIVPDPQGITTSDLDGIWVFQSLSFVDVKYHTNVVDEYNTVGELTGLNDFYAFVQLDFIFTTTNVTLSTTYLGDDIDGTGDWSSSPLSYVLDGAFIEIDGNYLKFEIMNAETFDGTELLLKMIDGNTDMPIGGTYTLH